MVRVDVRQTRKYSVQQNPDNTKDYDGRYV